MVTLWIAGFMCQKAAGSFCLDGMYEHAQRYIERLYYYISYFVMQVYLI